MSRATPDQPVWTRIWGFIGLSDFVDNRGAPGRAALTPADLGPDLRLDLERACAAAVSGAPLAPLVDRLVARLEQARPELAGAKGTRLKAHRRRLRVRLADLSRAHRRWRALAAEPLDLDGPLQAAVQRADALWPFGGAHLARSLCPDPAAAWASLEPLSELGEAARLEPRAADAVRRARARLDALGVDPGLSGISSADAWLDFAGPRRRILRDLLLGGPGPPRPEHQLGAALHWPGAADLIPLVEAWPAIAAVTGAELPPPELSFEARRARFAAVSDAFGAGYPRWVEARPDPPSSAPGARAAGRRLAMASKSRKHAAKALLASHVARRANEARRLAKLEGSVPAVQRAREAVDAWRAAISDARGELDAAALSAAARSAFEALSALDPEGWRPVRAGHALERTLVRWTEADARYRACLEDPALGAAAEAKARWRAELALARRRADLERWATEGLVGPHLTAILALEAEGFSWRGWIRGAEATRLELRVAGAAGGAVGAQPLS